MKTKFFLCLRPTVIETEDVVGDYIKLSPTVGSSYTTVSGNTSGRHNHRNTHNKKRVVPERYIRQLSIESAGGTHCLSGNVSDDKLEKDKLLVNDHQKKPTTIQVLSDRVNGGPRESNSGVYLMASSLFFTILLGKFFGILCTLIFVYSLKYPRRKYDGNDGRRTVNVVVKSPEEYNKRVIMEGLLERKSHHHRENNNNKYLSW